MSNPFASKQKTATQTTTTTPWAPQGTQLQYGFDKARQLLNAPGPTFAPFSTVAGFSPTQQQAQTMGSTRAMQGSPLNAAAQGHTMGVIGGQYLGQDNPFMNAAVEGIKSRVMPAVNSQFSQAGRYGSGLHADTMTRALAEAIAPLQFQTYGAERQAQENAAQYAPQLAGEDWKDIGMLDIIGQQQTQLGQNELNDALARWNFQQELPQNKLNDFMSLIGGAYGGSETSTIPYYTPGWGTQALGTAATIAGAVAPFVSDARMKTDIKRVGTLDDGTNVYAYRYKGQAGTHLGVIAQEVEQTHPNAVIEIGGIKHVDYAALTETFGD